MKSDQLSVRHETRAHKRIKALFRSKTSPQSSHLILCSGDDRGVIRNGGRLGSRFAPQAILNALGAMIAQANTPELTIANINRPQTLPALDDENFKELQANALQLMQENLHHQKQVVHLGGGHDHIFPWLMAIESILKATEELVIINIDAHLDTRIDDFSHSGTPFRQFGMHAKKPFTLLQWGIHPYANVAENYQALAQGKMEVVQSHEAGLQMILKHIEQRPQAQVIISLDADALSSQVMEAVSAVNPNGMEPQLVSRLISELKLRQKLNYFGIYEYNPLYDNLSQKGAKVLAYLLYEFFH